MRILGIDYGDARVGIAITDALQITAQGLETIHFDGSVEDFNKINTRESGIPSSVTIICKE